MMDTPKHTLIIPASDSGLVTFRLPSDARSVGIIHALLVGLPITGVTRRGEELFVTLRDRPTLSVAKAILRRLAL